MDVTQEQIIEEFKRQVRLCSGIGFDKMIVIVEEQFNKHIKKEHDWRFYMNGTFCIKCGRAIGTGSDCE